MNLLRHAFVVVLVCSAVVALVSSLVGSWTACAWGAALAGTNAIVADVINRWALGRSDRAFFNAVLVGIGARVALVPAAALALIVGLGLDPRAFVATFASLLALLLVAETATLYRITARRVVA